MPSIDLPRAAATRVEPSDPARETGGLRNHLANGRAPEREGRTEKAAKVSAREADRRSLTRLAEAPAPTGHRMTCVTRVPAVPSGCSAWPAGREGCLGRPPSQFLGLAGGGGTP